MASWNQLKNLRKCNNKFKHKWIDEGKRDTGIPNYGYECKYCGKYKIKSSTYAASYYDKDKKYLGNTAPECVDRNLINPNGQPTETNG